jgi:hypothetical protein
MHMNSAHFDSYHSLCLECMTAACPKTPKGPSSMHREYSGHKV